MSILSFILGVAIFGFCVYLILQIPMPQIFRTVIIGIVTIGAIFYVIQHFGSSVPAIK